MSQTIGSHPDFMAGQVRDVDGLVTLAEQGIVSRTLHNSPAGSLTLFAFDEGQALSEHTSPYDAFVQVLEGAARIRLDGEEHDVKAGQVLLMPGGVPHAVIAPARFKMLLTMFKTQPAPGKSSRSAHMESEK